MNGKFFIALEFLGLFRAAIMESGTAMNIWAYTINAREKAFELARTLRSNFSSNSSEDVLEVLQSASASELNEAATTVRVS